MPVFTIETPNGKHLDIEADDQDAALAGANHWYEQNVTSKTDTSLTSALSQGAADTIHGIGKTVQEYISPYAGNAIEGAGSSLAAPKYRSATEQFSHPDDGPENHFMGRDWSKLPRALVEQTPGAAADVAATLLTKRFGPIGQALAGAGSYALRTMGNEAQKRATARTGDTNATPTAEDKAIGAGSTFAQAALNQLALGKVLNPTKVAGVGASGIAKAAKNVAAGAVAEGATNAAQDAISQAASTVGTKDGLNIDPHSLVDNAIIGVAGGGLLGSPRGVKDAITSARFRNVGGDLAPASAAAANRLVEKAGSSEALQSPKDAFKATSAAHADTVRELAQAASGLRKLQPVPVDADNALHRAAQGRDLSTSDLTAIDNLDGDASSPVKALAKQATILARLKSKGSFNEGSERFSGGVSEKVRNFVTGNPLTSGGVYAGVNALTTGLDGLSTALASHALPAVGTYAALRSVERAMGLTSPARTFAEKFGDGGETSVRPEVPQASPVPQSPTGPKVTPQNSLTAPQPWGPVAPKPERFKPDMLESNIGKIVEKLQNQKRRDTVQEAMPLLRQLAATAKVREASRVDSSDAPIAPEHPQSGEEQPSKDSHQHPYAGLSDAEVKARAVQDAVDAGVIPNEPVARARYGQGVIRKRNAIREAVYNAANSDGYSDNDVELFQPFFSRLMVARTREEANSIILSAMRHLSGSASHALTKHLGSEFVKRVWKK